MWLVIKFDSRSQIKGNLRNDRNRSGLQERQTFSLPQILESNFSPWYIIQRTDTKQYNGQHFLQWFYNKSLFSIYYWISYQTLDKGHYIKA